MSIPWNKVTWYTKLGALVVVVIAASLGFYLWNEFQEVQEIKNFALVDTPEISKNSIVTEEISVVKDSSIIQFSGEVLRGVTFERKINANLVFRLVPRGQGWDIQVGNKTNPDSDFSRITLPLRGINSRQLNGWHFRNADNTGPNDGSVNAPQGIREFEFVVSQEDYDIAFDALTKLSWPYDYTDEEVDEASQQIYGGLKRGTGTLTVTDMELGNLEPNEQAWFERVKFNVALTLPTDTSDWKTYRNEEFGFELKYPPELVGLEDSWSRPTTAGIRFKLPNQQPQGAAAFPYIFRSCSEGCFIESGEPMCTPYLGSLPYEEGEVGGIPFKVGIYEMPQQRQGKTWLQVEYVGKKNDMCYAFSYGATQYEIEKDDRETIEANIARFEQILSTFRFIE